MVYPTGFECLLTSITTRLACKLMGTIRSEAVSAKRRILCALASACLPGTGQWLLGNKRAAVGFIVAWLAIVSMYWPLRLPRFCTALACLFIGSLALSIFATWNALRAPNDLVAKSPLWWLILLVPVAILAASAQSNWMLLAAGFRVFNLPSESMELTISKDDLIIVDLWRYRQSRPLPMQILVFSHAFVREKLKESYSEIGRPSIDPELLLRILLIGYLYGITSERKLVEELRMHLAWRWFTGLGFDQEIPHHSTFSKNRHGRFQESKLFEQLFEEIVRQCVEVGLVQGDNLSVDGSFVEANASKESRIPREQLAEAAQVNQTVRQYLGELEKQNPTEEPVA